MVARLWESWYASAPPSPSIRTPPMMTLRDIDFAERYRRAYEQSGRAERTPAYWDARAARMRDGASASAYQQRFVDALRLDDCRTLLDVGCGPGTIALAVAPRLDHVYGLDFSPAMLQAFRDEARQRCITHATAIQHAWNDDWHDVPVCDVVVASRATAVPDFEAAVQKLCAHARRRVYLTYPAFGQFMGDELSCLLGRAHGPLPDYLCVVGVLHHLGIHPSLSFLPDRHRFLGVRDGEDFLGRVRDYIGALTLAEEAVTLEYFARHRARFDEARMYWALLSWKMDETRVAGPGALA